jgi:hypothetical protein
MTLQSPTNAPPPWPAESIDPGIAWVDYAVVPDEFLVYFGGQPVPAISSPLHAPGFDDVAVRFALGADRKRTDEIVGVHVIPMMVGAVPEHPEWSVLTWAAMAGDYGDDLLRERLPIFLNEVADAYKQYWKPAPPIEEQLAQIAREAEKRKTA